MSAPRVGEATFADSPYRLAEFKRKSARAEVVKLLEAGSGDGTGTVVAESDLQLAKALLARAEKALEAASSASEETRVRVRAAMKELSAAVEARDRRVAELGDALSDALFDLM